MYTIISASLPQGYFKNANQIMSFLCFKPFNAGVIKLQGRQPLACTLLHWAHPHHQLSHTGTHCLLGSDASSQLASVDSRPHGCHSMIPW